MSASAFPRSLRLLALVCCAAAGACSVDRARCEAGDGESCCRVGATYWADDAPSPSDARATHFFRYGCQDGVAQCCFNMGLAYSTGRGVPLDAGVAAWLFYRACELGNLRGCVNAGARYGDGRGVPKDEHFAAELFAYACDAGDDMGCGNLRILAPSPSSEGAPVRRDAGNGELP
jgi:TPR repeat protein